MLSLLSVTQKMQNVLYLSLVCAKLCQTVSLNNITDSFIVRLQSILNFKSPSRRVRHEAFSSSVFDSIVRLHCSQWRIKKFLKGKEAEYLRRQSSRHLSQMQIMNVCSEKATS